MEEESDSETETEEVSVQENDDDDDDDPAEQEPEIVYKTRKAKPPQKRPSLPRPKMRPPPVQPLVETMVAKDFQIAAATGNAGNLIAMMQQYMGSAKLQGVGMQHVFNMSTVPGNLPILRQIGTASVLQQGVDFYGTEDATVAYYGPILLDSLAE